MYVILCVDTETYCWWAQSNDETVKFVLFEIKSVFTRKRKMSAPNVKKAADWLKGRTLGRRAPSVTLRRRSCRPQRYFLLKMTEIAQIAFLFN